MRVIIRIKRTVTPPQLELFNQSLVRRKRSWRAFFLSITAHVVFFIAVPPLARAIHSMISEELDLRNYSVEPLRFAIPKRLYFPRSLDHSKPEPEGRRMMTAELPAVVSKDRRLPTILQPQTQAFAAASALRLDRLMAWTPAAVSRPQARTDAPIVPGQRQDDAVLNSWEVSPELQIPNREAIHSNKNMASTEPLNQPSLPVLPSATVPVRILSPVVEDNLSPQQSRLDEFTGSPANLLVLSGEVSRDRDTVTVPLGSNVPTNDPRGLLAALGAEPGGIYDGNSQGPPDHPSGDKATTALPVSRLEDPGLAGVIRKVHSATGMFDIVVVQSSPEMIFPSGADTLTGKPVYTVYLEVGIEKAWILQFCLPRNAQTLDITGPVVQLAAMDTLQAPYPLLTLIPKSRPPHSAYLLFHGFLTESGRFRDLTKLSRADEASEFLSLLQKWEFRPATRGTEPVEVEILLAIPPAQSLK